MAIKFTTSKQSSGFVKCVVYGQSGIGKTRLIATAPTPLIISSEKKLISLKDFNIPVILIENAVDLQSAYDFIMNNEKAKHFETICLDSISDIAETILTDFKENPEDGNTHGQAAYGSMADNLGPLIKKFRDIPDRHVYFIAKAKWMKDEYTEITSWIPMMPGQVLGQGLPYLFDFVFPMRMGETTSGKKYRYLQTVEDIQWMAKGIEELDPIEKPDLTHLFKKVLEGEKGEKSKIVTELPSEEAVNEPDKDQETPDTVDSEVDAEAEAAGFGNTGFEQADNEKELNDEKEVD